MGKTNWLNILKNHLIDIKGAGWVDENLVAIQAVTDALPDAGALTSLAQDATVAKEASLAVLALEATLTAIAGGGWTNETLVAIKAAIDAIGASQAYQEQIPDTDFNLAAIPEDLATDPPSAPAGNSVVDIDVNAGDTFALRSLFVDVISFGTAGTKLTFKLWTMLNTAVTMVDSVDVASLGIQNLTDIFGLQEVHGDGIWITVQTDATPGADDGACSGTWRYAKAST